ncbi:MAG: ABC transporter permease [Atopobiaceae bacterium]|nr:ABC transporter permease [Atopobiaceae bacterium]
MTLGDLSLRNLTKNPGRSLGLIALVALISAAVFGGSLVMSGLSRGLTSLEERLGADVIVYPATAKSTNDLEAIMLDGVPGYFYMDDSIVEKVAAIPGVAQASPQYYLASVKAGCCSMPVQIIGFDPETDFTIQPWVARSYSRELQTNDVLAGSNISGAPGTLIRFYGVDCTIAGKLDETGTALDNAVFATAQTIKGLIAASEEQGMSVLATNNPDDIVSTIQLKLADGYSPDDMAGYIKGHVRGATAVAARSMTSGVADGVAAVSQIVSILIAVMWLVGAVILVIAFWIQGRSRSREFAVLRMIGASRKGITSLVLQESLMLGIVGACIGITLSALTAMLMSPALEAALGLPFLTPEMGRLALLVVLTFAVVLVATVGASVVSARRLSRVDAGGVLRGE